MENVTQLEQEEDDELKKHLEKPTQRKHNERRSSVSVWWVDALNAYFDAKANKEKSR